MSGDSNLRRNLLLGGFAAALVPLFAKSSSAMAAQPKGKPGPGAKATEPQNAHLKDTAGLLDRIAIEQVLLRERYSRETHDFDAEAACFTPDAFIEASWFKGSAKDFVDQGRKQAGAGAPSRLVSFDSLSPVVIWVNGDRAIADGSTAVHQILPIKGVEAHMTSFTRILSRLRRIDGEWLIAAKHAIYIRDTLDPLHPKEIPDIDLEKLKGYRPSYRHLSYILSLAGIPLRDDLPGVDRPEQVAALRIAEREWLMKG